MKKRKIDRLTDIGYTVQQVPDTLGYAVYFSGYRVDSQVHNSERHAWDWACHYLPDDPRGGKVKALRQRGFSVDCKDGRWSINHYKEPIASKTFGNEQEAWFEAIETFWELPDRVVAETKVNVKTILEAREKGITMKPMSSADLAKAMGFDTAEITKALDVVGKWLASDKPLTREQLAQQRIYLVYSKDTGHFYWWDLDCGIESSRAWETEEEALGEANKWLRNFHIINRSGLKCSQSS